MRPRARPRVAAHPDRGAKATVSDTTTSRPEDDFMAAFEAWWNDHGQFCRAGGGDYEKTFAFRAAEFATARATALERTRCAGIARSMGGDIDSAHPNDSKLCANSIEWEILGRPARPGESAASASVPRGTKES
jgi:hypothetical protein